MKRRHFLKSTVATGVAVSPVGRAFSQKRMLEKTPRDYEGPYYPRGPRNPTHDLITGTPRGKVLMLRGSVVDVHGKAAAGAIMDIWQTDLLGRYRHPADTSAGERWDDFLYWGEAPTAANGGFEFRTYVPGAYGRRPSHIHYKVWVDREPVLTSQIYFAERGGTQGQSRFPQHGDRQTTRVIDLDGQRQEAFFQVVI